MHLGVVRNDEAAAELEELREEEVRRRRRRRRLASESLCVSPVGCVCVCA